MSLVAPAHAGLPAVGALSDVGPIDGRIAQTAGGAAACSTPGLRRGIWLVRRTSHALFYRIAHGLLVGLSLK